MSVFYKKSLNECFSKTELNFRKSNQLAAAKQLGINPKNICVIGNCKIGETTHEDRVYIGSSYLANTNHKYFFIYQKCLTRKYTKENIDEFLNGYLISTEDLIKMFNSIDIKKRSLIAPNQLGRYDTLIYLLYNEFDDTYKFIIK